MIRSCAVQLGVVCVSTCYHHIYDQGWDKKMTEAGAASQHGSNTTQPTRAIRATLAGSNTTPGYPHQPTQSKVSSGYYPHHGIQTLAHKPKYLHTHTHTHTRVRVSNIYTTSINIVVNYNLQYQLKYQFNWASKQFANLSSLLCV